ncbi:hypothetical protein GCM10010182_82160 [Actinomadura cremea]|nr:hypothetical protein GCM10010182_82160 [Actinomadura cremea]
MRNKVIAVASSVGLAVGLLSGTAAASSPLTGESDWESVRESTMTGKALAEPPARRLTYGDVLKRTYQNSYVADSEDYKPGSPIKHQFNDDPSARSVNAISNLDECAGTIIGNPYEGYLKDRFSFCSNWDGKLDYKRDGKVVGGWTYSAIFVGSGFNGARKIEYQIRLDRISSWGVLPPEGVNPTLGFRIECYAMTTDKACNSKSQLSVSKTMAEWAISTHGQMNIQSDWGDGVGPDNVNFVGWELYDFTNLTPEENLDVSMSARFDSASYLPTKQGAVFPGVMPHILYKTSDAEVNETAEHIKTACDTPNLTVPTLQIPKVIPGCRDEEKKPIHRLFHDLDRRKKNRAESVRTCEAKWGDYPASGKDCDEFPFATTYEGSMLPDYDPKATPGMYSVRALTSSDNQKAGTRLGVWYGQDRIIDGLLPIDGKVLYQEPFRVWIQS